MDSVKSAGHLIILRTEQMVRSILKKKNGQCVWPHTMQHFIHYVVTGQKKL